MASVTQRISQIKPPRGGYLNIKEFNIIQFENDEQLSGKENVHPSTVGLVVDYLSRFMLNNDILESFKISIYGATIVNKIDVAYNLLKNIKGLDDNSIICATKMVGFDVAFRSGPNNFKGISHINPDKETINNIRIMVNRSIMFFEKYGPITKDGFTFEGAHTNIINTGDGDFLTKDTLFDFKVSKLEPSSKYTLQILIYYIMGQHTNDPIFKNITKIGLFNPRLNKMYICEIKNIDKDIIKEIETNVIGY